MVLPGGHKVRPSGVGNETLSRIVQALKSSTTCAYIKGVRDDGWQRFNGKLWQRGFYDRSLRTDNELRLAREYILGNPAERKSEERP